MKLVDLSGNEITSKENKKAREFESQLESKSTKMLEPIINKIKLSGSKIPEQQFMQIVSMAQSQLFNRLIFNLIAKVGINSIDELLTEDDVDELSTELGNQIKMVDSQEYMKQMQEMQGMKDKS